MALVAAEGDSEDFYKPGRGIIDGQAGAEASAGEIFQAHRFFATAESWEAGAPWKIVCFCYSIAIKNYQ